MHIKEIIHSAKTGETKVNIRKLSKKENDEIEKERRLYEDEQLKAEFLRQKQTEAAAVQQAEFETWKAEKKGK